MLRDGPNLVRLHPGSVRDSKEACCDTVLVLRTQERTDTYGTYESDCINIRPNQQRIIGDLESMRSLTVGI